MSPANVGSSSRTPYCAPRMGTALENICSRLQPDGRTMRTSTASPLAPATVAEQQRAGSRTGWAQSFVDDGPVDVSVCIANWNCLEYLRACITSLQDYPQGVRIETIVVDNASSDGAADMVAREFPEVVLVRNTDNAGFARASNQAADRARGRYVFFLNNDTIVPPDAAQRNLSRPADEHPDIGMVGPLLKDGTGRMQISYRQMPSMWAMLHRAAILRWTGLFKMPYGQYRRNTFQPEDVRRVDVLMGAAILMRRDIFESCGRWDEDFRFGVEDVEVLSARVGRPVMLLVFLPGVEVIHHGRLKFEAKNIAFSAPNHLIGYVHRRFRKTELFSMGRWLAYKTLVTIDNLIRAAWPALVQYAIRRAGGRREKAKKSRLAVLGYWHFLTRAAVSILKGVRQATDLPVRGADVSLVRSRGGGGGGGGRGGRGGGGGGRRAGGGGGGGGGGGARGGSEPGRRGRLPHVAGRSVACLR